MTSKSLFPKENLKSTSEVKEGDWLIYNPPKNLSKPFSSSDFNWKNSYVKFTARGNGTVTKVPNAFKLSLVDRNYGIRFYGTTSSYPYELFRKPTSEEQKLIDEHFEKIYKKFSGVKYVTLNNHMYEIQNVKDLPYSVYLKAYGKHPVKNLKIPTEKEIEYYKNKLPTLNEVSTVVFGGDPEFFLKQKDSGKVVGSEHLLKGKEDNNVIIDGVQIEINLDPKTCREYLSNSVRTCFQTIRDHLKTNPNFEISTEKTVKISKKELEKLSEENRKLGCDPSFSASGEDMSIQFEKIDAMNHKQRSAGGHIHLGFENDKQRRRIQKDPKRLVDFLDIIVGNTCVLIDRDPANKERRKLYGRAGEYRLPGHGLEYRTLSNFWLHDYALLSLVFGLARMACQMEFSTDRKKYHKAFTSAVDMEEVYRAINTNNYRLAQKNFNRILPLLKEILTASNHRYGLSQDNLDAFIYFYKAVQLRGLNHFFDHSKYKNGIVGYWSAHSYSSRRGWYSYSKNTIPDLMQKEPLPTPIKRKVLTPTRKKSDFKRKTA